MHKFIKSLARDESGVTAVEYAVLAGIVVIVLGVAGAAFGDALNAAFTRVTGSLTTPYAPS